MPAAVVVVVVVVVVTGARSSPGSETALEGKRAVPSSLGQHSGKWWSPNPELTLTVIAPSAPRALSVRTHGEE